VGPFSFNFDTKLVLLYLVDEKKFNDLLIIIWVFILVQPKLLSRVCCLDKKVMPHKHLGGQQPLDFGL